MRVSDIVLLAKKIAVGIAVTVVPLAILAGSLWLTQRMTHKDVPSQANRISEVSHAN